MTLRQTFRIEQPTRRIPLWGDLAILVVFAAMVYIGVRVAVSAPVEVQGPTISLSPSALPWYAALSVGRMAAAYALSLLFTLVYGRLAAYQRRAEIVLMPLLDVLQSVPILSFLPVVLLSLSAVLPEALAAELASIVLIFTSQAWNMTFAWYQSLTTIPKELREAGANFRLNSWLRFKTLELPFAANSLIWNSMMSWAGGWFFLMAAEIFTVGARDFRLPGLGAYLHQAATEGNLWAIGWGIGALVAVIVALDQLVWRPLLAWGDRFNLEMVESDNPPTSWFYDILRHARLLDWLGERVWNPLNERLDAWFVRRYPADTQSQARDSGLAWWSYVLAIAAGAAVLYAVYHAVGMLAGVPASQWAVIGAGIGATLLRVLTALVIALTWTIPVGVLIGTQPRLARVLQPMVQIAASVPATALFPVIVLLLIRLPGGLDVAAVLLMLMGTQWYLLFNVIAGASAIPQDLKYTTAMLQLSRWERWRTLILPALFPYIVTGAVTAGGGAWNASIVAEYVQFGGHTMHTTGIGALIASATTGGDFGLLLAATLSMIFTVVIINRLLWRRLYRIAENRYRME